MSRRSLIATLTAGAGAVAVGATPAQARENAQEPEASRAPLRADGHTTRLVLLGTAGGPPWWPNSNREGISSALVVGDRYYVIDAGDGVGRQLRKARLGSWQNDLGGPLDKLAGVFLTHLHSDHIVDLNNLLTEGLSNGIPRADLPIPLIGPGNRGALPPLFGPDPTPPVVAPENPTPGTREMWEAMVRAYATDFNDRARDSRKPVPDQFVDARDIVLPSWATDDPNGAPAPDMAPVPVYEDDHIRVTGTLVDHAPVFPALAYRFDTEDGSVVFSGDTAPCDNLVRLARDADVLVHEVIDRTWPESMFPEPRTPAQEASLHHLLNAHTTVEDVGPVAERAGVRTLVLSHLVPGNRPDSVWREARHGFSGRLLIGHDLDEVGIGERRR
ncbi:MBL fold metallo-hydrolase [Streptomyces sp. B-S-A8]|uniref:MBL fold metallo-hydrolase n=1 Tax=Streptomyces solicavernae TaxID=3043614 RepID=A0ABT6RTL5_9ACTN|nr:MBL fold metallo-hydrolase [Streptomyces sp. B-S-A8]MDI3387660.1 MBL fold metallo-hydrolase [Streptomyces sp. B-S-A8]